MQPTVELNWLAIGAAVVASFVIGSVWYGVVFRDMWQRAMGFTGDMRPSGAETLRGSIIGIVVSILTAYVLARWIGAWQPAAWGGTGEADSDFNIGILVSLMAWAGFVVPVLATGVAYERKSWALFVLNALFQVISIVVMGLIIAFWK
jgi:hypothetical protein